jgi:hypothetical protein
MIGARLHTKAADPATLVESDNLSPVASAPAEARAVMETVDFASTLQDLIDSTHQKASHAAAESSVAPDPSTPQEASPRTPPTTTSTAGSERLVNRALAAILSSDATRAAARSAYVAARNPEAARAYQPSTYGVEPLRAAARSATNSGEPRDQSISSDTTANSVETTGHSAPAPHPAASVITSSDPTARDLELTTTQAIQLPTISTAVSLHLRSSNFGSTHTIAGASSYAEPLAPSTTAVVRQTPSHTQDPITSAPHQRDGSDFANVTPRVNRTEMQAWPLSTPVVQPRTLRTVASNSADSDNQHIAIPASPSIAREPNSRTTTDNRSGGEPSSLPRLSVSGPRNAPLKAATGAGGHFIGKAPSDAQYHADKSSVLEGRVTGRVADSTKTTLPAVEAGEPSHSSPIRLAKSVDFRSYGPALSVSQSSINSALRQPAKADDQTSCSPATDTHNGSGKLPGVPRPCPRDQVNHYRSYRIAHN